MTANVWRYVQLESAARGPTVARVFANNLSYCGSIICINLNNLGIRNTEFVLKNTKILVITLNYKVLPEANTVTSQLNIPRVMCWQESCHVVESIPEKVWRKKL